MKILLCLSNMFVPTVLTQILADKTEKFIVVVFEQGLKCLFENFSLANVDLFYFKYPRVFQTWICKKRILQYFRDKNDSDVYFYHDAFGGICNWLIVILSKRNNIYYFRYVNTLHLSITHDMKSYILRAINILLYGFDINVYQSRNKYVYGFKSSFFTKVRAKYVTIETDYDLLRSNLPLLEQNNHKKIVLLTGSIVTRGAVEKDEYVRKIDALITEISKEKMILKCHPRFVELYGKECELEVIPSYIPANLILNKDSIFIGYTTTALVEAAKIGAKAISLLHYLKATDDEVVRRGHKYLNTSLGNNGTICFPTNLMDILNEIRENQ